VYEDEEEWFREIFSGSKKEDAIRNQYEFLVQRMGGPPLFSQRRGNLIDSASLNSKAPFILSKCGRFSPVGRTSYGCVQQQWVRRIEGTANLLWWWFDLQGIVVRT
jgi:hypothetical protein